VTQDLIDAANTLADVLARENAALTRLDFLAAVALGPSKEAALLRVTEGCSAAATPDRSPAMLALGRGISTLVAENRRLLERAISIQTRIVGIIVRAAAPPSVAGQYAPSGLKRRRRGASATALSLGA
jgi:hypothetical protein